MLSLYHCSCAHCARVEYASAVLQCSCTDTFSLFVYVMLAHHLVHVQQQEKQRLYHEIKAILARQPGPEVAEQLSVYQAR
jgi:hypothetical protein